MSLIHWWPLVDHYKDNITGVTLTNKNVNTTTNNKLGRGYSFGPLTTDSRFNIDLTNFEYPTTKFSIALWFKFNGWGTYYDTLLGLTQQPAWSGNICTIARAGTSSKIHFCISNGSSATQSNCQTSTSIELGKWYHLVCIYNEGSMTMCLDGKQDVTYTTTIVPDFSKVVTGNIGRLDASYYQTNSQIQDVRIYDHALSQAEVKELSKALVMHYSFDDTLAEPTANLITSPHNIKYVSGASDNNISAAGLINVATTTSGTYTLSGEYNIAASDSATGPRITMLVKYEGESNWSSLGRAEVIRDGTWRAFTLTGTTNPSKKVACCGAWLFDYSTAGSARSCYARNLQFELKDFATPYTPTSRESMLINEAGYANPSSVTNFKLSTISNNGSYSGYFDGQTSCIDTPVIKPNMFTEDYTLSFWVYPLDSGRAVYFGDHQISSVPTVNFERTADGAFRYYHNGSPDKSFANTNTPEKTWTMLTVTYTPGTMKVYKNGVLAETLSHTATITKNINGIMRIGRDNRTGSDYGATPLYGYISDFRFYVTCLSAGDVQELYKTKAYVTDKGDIMCGEFIENKNEAGVTEKSIFECNETQEKLNIPGFELLDGILIEKNPYFDTGLVFGDVNKSIYVDAEVTPTNTSGNNCLAGGGNSDWNGPIMLNFCGGKMEFGTSGYSTSTEPQGKFAANERLTVQAEIYPTTQKWYKNNVQINNITQRDRKTTNATFAIGTFKTSSGTVGASHSFKGYIHRFYVKYGDEIRCYLPVKRKSDNVYGLYDIHTKTFLVNSGGGTVSGTTSTLCDEAAIYQDGYISGREIIEL